MITAKKLNMKPTIPKSYLVVQWSKLLLRVWYFNASAKICSFPIIERFFKSALSAEGIGTGEDVQFREELTRNLGSEFLRAEMVECSN